MSKFSLGPIDFRFYSGDNWSHAEVAFVTNRDGGMARRESAIKAGFKSDHLTDMIGRENPADSFEDPQTGTLYFGKIVQTPTGVHTISAREVYTKALCQKVVKQGLSQATNATQAIEATPQGTNGHHPATPEPTTAA